MSRDFSKVASTVWRSRKFRGLKDDDARYVYLYLLTNSHCNSAGCYDMLEGYVIADLEWSGERVRAAMERLSKAFLIDVDEGAETVLIVNWVTFNEPTNAKHAIGVLTQLSSVSSERLKDLRFLEFAKIIEGKKFTNDRAAGGALESLMQAFREGIRTRPRLDIDRDQTETRPRLDQTETARGENLAGVRAAAPDGASLTPPDEKLNKLLNTDFLKGAA